MTPPNLNNDILKQGCEKLGYSWQVIPRNVKGCWNLGYCGVGCPTNAKQGALMTTIPGAWTTTPNCSTACAPTGW